MFKIMNYTKTQNQEIKIENKIKKIINVYQEKYLNRNSTGLGDFIRGSIFLLQYCKLYNIECEISLKNHNIYKFLNNYNNDSNTPDLSIEKNIDLNIKKFYLVKD